jgi:hypothetical protein
MRLFAECIVSDQDWCPYFPTYLDDLVTFYNAGHPGERRLVLTVYDINQEWPRSPQPGLEALVNFQQTFRGFADRDLSAEPTVVP